MASQSQVLKALATKDAAVTPAEIAAAIMSTGPTVVSLLHKLKKKGHVEGSGSEWVITDAGKAEAEKAEEIPMTRRDVGQDEESQFVRFGQLAGVDRDKIEAALDLFLNLDMRSMENFEKVMADINIPQTLRHVWRSLYLSYLRNTTAPEERDELYPPQKPPEPGAEGSEVVVGERVKGETRDYLIEGTDMVRVGDDLGMFTFRQALQVLAVKRGTSTQSQATGVGSLTDFAEAVSKLNPNQPLTVENILAIIKQIKEASGDGTGAGGPTPTFVVDGEGNTKQLQPGEPYVVKQVQQQPGKSYFLNPETHQMEEIDPAKPIVIQIKSDSPNPGMGVMPFPVMGEDGQPVLDKDGKPVYANLDPMMRWYGFQSDQRRAGERHEALMGLVATVKENAGDGIAALREAAQHFTPPGERKAAAEPPVTGQIFRCGDCQTEFKAPQEDFLAVKCPNPACERQYSREELLAQ